MEITVGLIFIGPSVLMLFGPKVYWIGAVALMVSYTVAFWFEEGPNKDGRHGS